MAELPVTVKVLVGWLEAFRARVHEERDRLTDLDRAIGDADHGLNLDRGMTSVGEKVLAQPPDTVDTLGKAVGMALVGSVGGASGPLYGTFFLRLGTAAGPVPGLDAAGLGAVLRAGYEGVLARGRAEAGDKTMVDALGPAVTAYEAALADGSSAGAAARAAADAAAAGRDATEPMVARKGRASYLGERSAGHLDPGAASSALLVESLAAVLQSAAARG